MDFSDVNRRNFLKTSATVTAAGAGLAASSAAIAAQSQAEADAWKNRIGNKFTVGDAQLQLQRVNVKRHNDRPHNVRPLTISMLFVVTHGTADTTEQHYLENGQLMISPIVAPEGETGQYFEGIIA